MSDVPKDLKSPLPPLVSSQAQLYLGQLFKEINRKLSTENDYLKILDFIFESFDLIIPYDRMGIALIEGSGDDMPDPVCCKWVRSKISATHLVAGHCDALQGSSLQRILETGQPRILNDLKQYAEEHPNSASTQPHLPLGRQ